MPRELTFDEKFEIINALAEASLKMRKPNDWYVSQHGVEIGDGQMLRSGRGDGPSPNAAIDAHFRSLTELKPGERIVLHAYGSNREEYRWNGYRWQKTGPQT